MSRNTDYTSDKNLLGQNSYPEDRNVIYQLAQTAINQGNLYVKNS